MNDNEMEYIDIILSILSIILSYTNYNIKFNESELKFILLILLIQNDILFLMEGIYERNV